MNERDFWDSAQEGFTANHRGDTIHEQHFILVNYLTTNIKRFRTALVVGVGGCAREIRLLSQLGLSVTGADVSPKMIAASAKFTRAPMVETDVRQLPFTTQSFDIVVAIWVLSHIPDSDVSSCISELARVGKEVFLTDLFVLKGLPNEEIYRADLTSHANMWRRNYREFLPKETEILKEWRRSYCENQSAVITILRRKHRRLWRLK